MWKSIGKLSFAGGTLALLVAGIAGASNPNPCWSGSQAARVWPEVMFRTSADLGDYRRTLSQTRDQVRQMLEQEYTGMVAELASEFENPEALLEPVLAAVLAFDALHDQHRKQAAAGLPVYVEVGVRSALDQLYRTHRITAERRRLGFATVDLARRLELARNGLENGATTTLDRDTLLQVAESVDLVAYATLASDGEEHHLTLTLENLHTGSLCDYAATGPLEEVNGRVADAVFRGFQAVPYPDLQDPNPHLTWVRPAAGGPIATAEQAAHYCATQGARLPYALELVTAAQVGAGDATYVAGGIPRLEPGLWAVADRQRNDTPHFYFEPLAGTVDSHPAGPVRTSAGLGPVRARYWCVRGAPEARVTRIDDLYSTYRNLRSSEETVSATSAVEYLLNREHAMGARPRFNRAYPNDRVAWEQVWDGSCVASARAPAGTVAAGGAGSHGCPTPGSRHRARAARNSVN